MIAHIELDLNILIDCFGSINFSRLYLLKCEIKTMKKMK